MKKIIHIVFFCLISIPFFAQTKTEHNQLNSLIDLLEENDRWMGSIALSEKGILTYERALGYANREDDLAATTDNHYRIGSISKMFTTVLVFQAIESNKLKLEDKLSSFFPKVINAEDITIAHLLQHRSGITNFTNDPSYLDWNTEAHTREQLMQRIVDAGTQFDPDTDGSYSNSAYVILSYILEDIWKKPYEELIEKRIAKPLKLKNTYMARADQADPAEVSSYSYLGKWTLESVTHPSVPLGAGAIVSTPAELCQFGDALFAGKLINEEHLKMMMTVRDDYGMGMFSYSNFETPAYGHTGGIDGFSSFLVHFPELDMTLAISSNGKAFDNDDIVMAALHDCGILKYEMPSFEQVELSEEEIVSYLGSYTSEAIPLGIVISRDGDKVLAQASGQSAFFLDAKGDHKFEFQPAGIEMLFEPSTETFTLFQGGQEFPFSKE